MIVGPEREQVEAAIAAVRQEVAPARIVGAYLYGSTVDGGLRPDSDLDIFIVTDRPLEAIEKGRVVGRLLPISGRETRPPAWRPLEVTIVAEPEVRSWRYPVRMELQYGEWLRERFLAGQTEPSPAASPDLAVVMTMVRARSRALIGRPAADVLDAVPRGDLERAMLESLPGLLDDLEHDTRNVLLTLARMWMTMTTGEIGPKDEAADWAREQLPEEDRPMLVEARDLYRGGGYGEWPDAAAVRRLAERMAEHVRGRAELD